jgi:hypothetical protein
MRRIPKSALRGGTPQKRSGARSEERGGCIVPPNATNFREEVEPVVLDSLSPVAPAPGVGAARATRSRVWDSGPGFSSGIELHRVTEIVWAQSEIELRRVKSSFELQFTIGTRASTTSTS